MTKIRVRVGEVEVEYEGAESFLDKKLPALIVQLSKLNIEAQPRAKRSGGGGADNTSGEQETGTLASFLQKHNAGKNQVRRFLVTAQWLHLRGTQTIKTAEVSKALQTNHQAAWQTRAIA